MIKISAMTVAPPESLADQIHDDLRRRDDARENWITATIDLCTHLVEARGKFTANQEFSKWLEEHNLGPDVLSKDDRAAAIAMGEHLDRARDVLEHTERRSLRLIHDQEFRVRSAANTPDDTAVAVPGSSVSRRKPKPEGETKAKAKPRESEVPEATKRAIAAAVMDDGKTLEAAAREFGGGSMQVAKIAVAEEKGRRQAAEEQAVTRDDLSMSAQQKLDVLLRKHQLELDTAFEQRVQTEVTKRLEETVLPFYQQKVKDAERVIKARKNIIPRATFRTILAALHPDQRDPDKITAAFTAFKQLELVLVGEAENPTEQTTMPRTVEDLLKMRKTKRR